MTSAVPVIRGEAKSWFARLIERPSPLAKQFPTVLLLIVGVALVVILDSIDFTSVLEASIGIAGIVVATGLAAVLTLRGTWEGWVVLLVPMIDILALGFFRSGTGGVASLFGGFVLLPVVWLASAPHRRYILVAAGLAAIGQLLPFFSQPPSSGEQWLRGVITPLVFAMAAVVVNELSRLQRERTELARRLLGEFQSVWDAATAQALISTDLDGVVLRWNPGAVRLFGQEESAVAGRLRVDALFPETTLAALAKEAAPAAAGDPLAPGVRGLCRSADAGEHVEREVDLIGRGDGVLPTRLTVTPRLDARGEQVGYLIVITDESRAAEVARLKDEFVGAVSHELRTPLSSILGYLELIEDDETRPLDPEHRKFLGIIQRNARRLAKLVGDLLFTAKVEAGQFPLEPRIGMLLPVVTAAVDSARPTADQAGIELVLHTPPEIAEFRFDPERIGQTLDNLLSNALKFTPAGGRVEVRVEDHGAEVALTVSDTGPGIAAEDLVRIFDRFARAPAAARDMVPGVGLGLAISQAIVKAHGGTIAVESEVGVGTAFTVRLPTRA